MSCLFRRIAVTLGLATPFLRALAGGLPLSVAAASSPNPPLPSTGTSFTVPGPEGSAPQDVTDCVVTAWQPTLYASLRMQGYGSIICSEAVAELQLQECMQNLVTGGWRTTICLPSASGHYTKYGTSYIDGELIQSGCVEGRWYRMWAWKWAWDGSNASSATDTSNGTQCETK